MEPTILIPKSTVEYAIATLTDRYENMSHYAHFLLRSKKEITHHIKVLEQAHAKVTEKSINMWMCPICGDVVTEEDILDDINEGGFGMCMCSYGNGRRIYIQYERYLEA